MHKSFPALGAALVASTPVIAATEDPAPPPPPYTLTANVSLVSDYTFRGLTQMWHQPAIQGGFDFVHSSGFYAGTWASNVSGNQFAGGNRLHPVFGKARRADQRRGRPELPGREDRAEQDLGRRMECRPVLRRRQQR